MNRAILLALAAWILVAFPQQASAEDSEKVGTLIFVQENDLFYRTDQHYTNGLEFIWIPGRDMPVPAWADTVSQLIPWFPDQGEVHHSYAYGQSMFTSSDITIQDPPANERPYAGWLYGAIGLGVQSGKQLDLWALTIGVVGPASMAEQSQKFIHRIIGNDEPQGWDTQLGNELGAVASYQRSWRETAIPTPSGGRLDLTHYIGASIGNVFTYGNVGVTVRYGRKLPNDYGPQRIQQGQPSLGDFAVTQGFGWYLFAGVEGRVVARNIFLDGNTFGNSRSVEKEIFVADFQYGLVMDWRHVRLNYTHVNRTKEFRGQGDNDDFGVINLSLKF